MVAGTNVRQIRPEDQPLWDALPGLVARAEKFVRKFGFEYTVWFDETNTLCDPGIEIDGTGIGVTIMWGEKNTISGPVPVLLYGAYTTTFIPAVMYHRDGSGTPPDVDIKELGDASESMDEALVHALKALIEFEVGLIRDAEAAARAADEADAQWVANGGPTLKDIIALQMDEEIINNMSADLYSNDTKGKLP